MDHWPSCIPRDPRFWTRRAFTTAFGIPLTVLIVSVQRLGWVVLPMILLAVAWHLYSDYKCYWRALVPDGPPTPYIRAVALGLTTGLAFATLYAVAFF